MKKSFVCHFAKVTLVCNACVHSEGNLDLNNVFQEVWQ